MQDVAPVVARSLGSDLRALRRTRGLTLVAASKELGRSVGWLSQVERDISEPSIEDLKDLARLLDVPLSMFFGAAPAPAGEDGLIVRKGARRSIGTRMTGLAEELLSPDLTDDFEMVRSVFEPGAILAEPVRRPTQELGFVLSGRLDLVVDGRDFTVGPGDSFRIRAVPFTWANPYSEPAVAIWVIAPPVY
ncbi:MAG: cupin domain-containing protein [Pseudomonadota bacterium]